MNVMGQNYSIRFPLRKCPCFNIKPLQIILYLSFSQERYSKNQFFFRSVFLRLVCSSRFFASSVPFYSLEVRYGYDCPKHEMTTDLGGYRVKSTSTVPVLVLYQTYISQHLIVIYRKVRLKSHFLSALRLRVED